MTDTLHKTHDWSPLSGLMLTASRLVDGLYNGSHGSPRQGTGIEFHDYRPYCPGDDYSQIDWKLFGRTNRYYLRRAKQLSDLHIHLLLDHTASMDFAGLTLNKPTKLQYAAQLAAGIAFLAIRQADRVGISMLAHKLTAQISPASTWKHLKNICSLIEQTPPHTGPGNIIVSLKQALAATRQHGLVVLISDLLDKPTPVLESLSQIKHQRFDVIVLQLLTLDEINLSQHANGHWHMIDPETTHSIRTHSPSVIHNYNRLMSRHLAMIRDGCKNRGIDYHLIRTDQSPIASLRQFLIRRTAINQ